MKILRNALLAFFASTAVAGAATIDLGSASPLDYVLIVGGGKGKLTANNETAVQDYWGAGPDKGTTVAPAGQRKVVITGDTNGGTATSKGEISTSGNGFLAGEAIVATGTKTKSGDAPQAPNTTLRQGARIDDALVLSISRDLTSFAAQYSDTTWQNDQVTAGDATVDNFLNADNKSEIKESTTITATKGQTIVNVGNINLSGGDTLTLDGNGLDAQFIINVTDNELRLNGGEIVLTGGLTFDEVLFNVAGKIESSGGGNASVFRGTFLSQDKANFSPGLIEGSVFSMDEIVLVSGADVATPVPLPLPGLLLGGGLLGLGLLRMRKARGAAAAAADPAAA